MGPGAEPGSSGLEVLLHPLGYLGLVLCHSVVCPGPSGVVVCWDLYLQLLENKEVTAPGYSVTQSQSSEGLCMLCARQYSSGPFLVDD